MGTTPVGTNGLTTISGTSLVQLVNDYQSSQLATDAAISQAKSQATNGDTSTLNAAKTYTDGEVQSDRGRLSNIETKNTQQDTAIGQTLTDAKAYADQRDVDFRTVDRALWRSEDQIILQAAKDDATTRFGGLPARVTTVETRTTTQALGAAHLDTIATPGIYGQASSGTAIKTNGYPTESQGRGVLTVELVGGTNIAQTYFATFLGQKYSRERSGGTWSTWTVQTPDVSTPLGTADLDAILTPGTYGQGTTSQATAARHYPVEGRGVLTVKLVFGTNIGQEYWATFEQRRFIRERHNGAWSVWKDITAATSADTTDLANDIAVLNAEQDTQDGRLGTLEAQTGLSNPVKDAAINDGLLTFTLADDTVTNGLPVPASLPVDQADYVEQFRRRSTTTTLELRKTASNNAIEVSAVSPSGKHTTYAFYGAGNFTNSDDYRIQSNVWVGDSTGSTRNKTTVVGPASNKDFAFWIKPAGSASTPQFVPYHSGIPTAYIASPVRIFDGDTEVDVAAMAVGAVRQLSRFEIVQHVYGRHPDQSGVNLIEVWTSQVITPNGVLSVDGRMRVLADVAVNPSYTVMAPVDGALFDQVVSSLGNAYPNNPSLYGTVTWLPESDVGTSYAFLSSTSRDIGVAFRYSNPAETVRRGEANKPAASARARLEHSTATTLKIYNTLWSTGTVLPAGTIHRFSGDYVYLRTPGLYDQLAL